MRKLLIIGAGGHGRVVADIAGRTGRYQEIAFLDDRPQLERLMYPCLGPCSKAAQYLKEYDVFVAVGNTDTRVRFMRELADAQASFATIVAPDAVVAQDVVLGKGTVVMPGVIINTGARVGDGVILNTACSVDHDCIIDDFCHLAVGSHLCGTVCIGSQTWVGAGAIITNNVDICGGCTIGAGAVVVKNIVEMGVYLGIPATKKER